MFYSQWRLGLQDAEEPRAIRRKVFTDELGIPVEQVLDRWDEIAAHLLIFEDGRAIAAGRMYPKENGDLWADQVAVLPDYRGRFYGDLCVRLILYKGQTTAQQDIVIAVPETSMSYFARFGFQSDETDEKGMHIMRVNKDAIIWHSQCGDH